METPKVEYTLVLVVRLDVDGHTITFMGGQATLHDLTDQILVHTLEGPKMQSPAQASHRLGLGAHPGSSSNRAHVYPHGVR